jgi:hypothetical protein
MMTFEKYLSANDTGQSGSHQSGILVPKKEVKLLEFFPCLQGGMKNPDAMLDCQDEDGTWWKFRYIYYNNRFHDLKGTRNEYRITRITKYLRLWGAKSGDTLQFTQRNDGGYDIKLCKKPSGEYLQTIKLAGWRQVH